MDLVTLLDDRSITADKQVFPRMLGNQQLLAIGEEKGSGLFDSDGLL